MKAVATYLNADTGCSAHQAHAGFAKCEDDKDLCSSVELCTLLSKFDEGNYDLTIWEDEVRVLKARSDTFEEVAKAYEAWDLDKVSRLLEDAGMFSDDLKTSVAAYHKKKEKANV